MATSSRIPGLWVVIPAWNESRAIEDVVVRVRELADHVVVVDDGSEDATASLAVKAGAIVLRHPINLGQGAALQTGITFALKSNAQWIATFDADGQHQAGDIAGLFDSMARSGADVALGSRFLGSAPGMPRHRRALLKMAVLYTRATTSLRVTDAHNGLRLFTRAAASKIRILQNRMAHASEILECIAQYGLRFVEVPVTIVYTEYSMHKGQRTGDALKVLTDLVVGRFHK